MRFIIFIFMSRFRFIFLIIFAIPEIFGRTVPNIEFEVNRNAALFAQVYFENDISGDLHNEIKSSFGSNSKNSKEEKAEFVSYLISGRTEHSYMTPNFMNLWKNAKSKYDKVFDDNVDILNDRKQELGMYAKKALSEKTINFKTVFDFYGSSIGENESFKIFLFPTKMSSGNFSKAFKNNLFLKFNYGNKTADICAILEQVCHRLFESRSKSSRDMIENYFMSHHSKSAKAAYFLLDEVLAYAIGGLWSHSKLSGISDSALPNHSNPKIEAISKAILPTIEKYVKTRHEIDNNFYNSFIRQVELQYPKSSSCFDVMLSKISLIVESGIDVTYCQNVLTSSFSIDDVLDKVSNYSVVFIGKNLGDPVLQPINSKIPNKKNDFLFITKDNKKKLFIIIKTNDESKIKSAIKEMKKAHEISIGFIKDL